MWTLLGDSGELEDGSLTGQLLVHSCEGLDLMLRVSLLLGVQVPENMTNKNQRIWKCAVKKRKEKMDSTALFERPKLLKKLKRRKGEKMIDVQKKSRKLQQRKTYTLMVLDPSKWHLFSLPFIQY